MAPQKPIQLEPSQISALQDVANGTRSSIWMSRSMDDAHFAAFCRGLENKPKLDTISFSQNYLSEAGVQSIAKVLSTNPQIKKISLRDSGIDAKAFKKLVDSVRNHPTLSELELAGNNLGVEGTKYAIDLIQTMPSLKKLNIERNQIGDEGAYLLADMLAKNTTLSVLQTSNNRMTPDGRMALAGALRTNRTINQLTIDYMYPYPDPEKKAMAEIIKESKHKNLDSFGPYMYNMGFNLSDNKTKAKEALKKVLDTDLSDLTLREFHAVEERKPLVENRLADWDFRPPYSYGYTPPGQQQPNQPKQKTRTKEEALKEYDALKAALPAVPALGKKTKVDSLFKANDKGFSVLDNPKTWEDPKALFDFLAEADPAITKEFLARKTPKDMTFLECALTAAPVDQALQGLNRLGFHLRASELVEQGKPNESLKLLIERGEVNKIFTIGNWRGASPAELGHVLKALPKNVADSIPNRHSLMGQLRASVMPGPEYNMVQNYYAAKGEQGVKSGQNILFDKAQKPGAKPSFAERVEKSRATVAEQGAGR